MASWFAKRRGDDAKVVWDIVPYMMLAGLLGGRLGHVLFYDLHYFITQPLEIVKIWDGGLSVFGGLIACVGTGLWYLKRHQLDVWRYADVLVFGLPFGKVFGRIGCFLIHDHPGTLTDFVLGVRYPDGEVHHDLGLYLAINAFSLSLLFLWLSRRDRPVGMYVIIFALWYGVARFALDFLRIADVHVWGLTPGQFFSIPLFFIGISTALWIRNTAQKEKIG